MRTQNITLQKDAVVGDAERRWESEVAQKAPFPLRGVCGCEMQRFSCLR
jgi:hypothetical protein